MSFYMNIGTRLPYLGYTWPTFIPGPAGPVARRIIPISTSERSFRFTSPHSSNPLNAKGLGMHLTYDLTFDAEVST